MRDRSELKQPLINISVRRGIWLQDEGILRNSFQTNVLGEFILNHPTSDSHCIKIQVIHAVALVSISVNGKCACVATHTLVGTDSPKGFCLGAKAAVMCTFFTTEIELSPLNKCSIFPAQQKMGLTLKDTNKPYILYL